MKPISTVCAVIHTFFSVAVDSTFSEHCAMESYDCMNITIYLDVAGFS